MDVPSPGVRQPPARHRQPAAAQNFGHRRRGAACAQLQAQHGKPQRHGRLHPPHRHAVGQRVRCLHLGGHKPPARQRQRPAHQGGKRIAKRLHQPAHAASGTAGSSGPIGSTCRRPGPPRPGVDRWPWRSAASAPNMASTSPRCCTRMDAFSTPWPISGRMAISTSDTSIISSKAAEASHRPTGSATAATAAGWVADRAVGQRRSLWFALAGAVGL